MGGTLTRHRAECCWSSAPRQSTSPSPFAVEHAPECSPPHAPHQVQGPRGGHIETRRLNGGRRPRSPRSRSGTSSTPLVRPEENSGPGVRHADRRKSRRRPIAHRGRGLAKATKVAPLFSPVHRQAVALDCRTGRPVLFSKRQSRCLADSSSRPDAAGGRTTPACSPARPRPNFAICRARQRISRPALVRTPTAPRPWARLPGESGGKAKGWHRARRARDQAAVPQDPSRPGRRRTGPASVPDLPPARNVRAAAPAATFHVPVDCAPGRPATRRGLPGPR